jgi:two-component system chemotaxis sensor kinase CheA
MDLTTFYIQFRDETLENLRIVSDGLLALESRSLNADDRKNTIDAVFRAMHTIKGSGRMLGLDELSRIAHACEHVLGAVRDGRRELDTALANDLLRGGDAIQEMVTALIDGRAPSVQSAALLDALGKATPPPAEGAPADIPPGPAADPGAEQLLPAEQLEPTQPANMARGSRNASRQTVRVRVDRLDRLLNLAGDLKIDSQTEDEHLQGLNTIEQQMRAQMRALVGLEAELRRMRFSPSQQESINKYLNAALNASEGLGLSMHSAVERFAQHTAQSAQIVDDLEQEVMAARLLPISTLFSNLPRAVRTLAAELHKEVNLSLVGETTELDRKAIEALGDPLMHLVRNAVDHGLETAAEREQAGKPRQGNLAIKAEAMGAFVHITIHDDGRGIDPQRLRATAVRKGLINNDVAQALTDQEAIELVFMPGFTTAAMITDVSGRGVGMDVVRTNIVELGGQVQIASEFGAGTTVTITLPLTLVTTRVVLIECGSQLFGLPASGCRSIVWVHPSQVRTIESRAMLPRAEGLATLLRLDEVLGISHSRQMNVERTPAVLVGDTSRPIALLVDRLLDEREVVVKPLGPLLDPLRRYSGAFQVSDGRLALLLNPVALAQMTRGMALAATPAATTAQRTRNRLLIADDSFATRELIRSILSSAGYDVTTAVDGLDALDKLRADQFDLVVSDVEMPRVDGFQLTSRIRSELGKNNLPVIIVTSLASETHRRRGLEAGAQAYIIKSQFNQGNLIDTIRQLLGA